jgi:hypothetical protein
LFFNVKEMTNGMLYNFSVKRSSKSSERRKILLSALSHLVAQRFTKHRDRKRVHVGTPAKVRQINKKDKKIIIQTNRQTKYIK